MDLLCANLMIEKYEQYLIQEPTKWIIKVNVTGPPLFGIVSVLILWVVFFSFSGKIKR